MRAPGLLWLIERLVRWHDDRKAKRRQRERQAVAERMRERITRDSTILPPPLEDE